MRATLADPALVRHAGRFVWLELDFDKPVNQPFLSRHGVGYTPTLLLVDPADERALASHVGGLSAAELSRFLDAGERRYRRESGTAADSVLARADESLGAGRYAESIESGRAALRLGGPDWPEHAHAVRSLTWALWLARESQACAETAAAEAPGLARDGDFGAIVLAGLACSASGGGAAWAGRAATVLEPLAEEAVVLPTLIRDHRYQLYQTIIQLAQSRGDSATAVRWGHRWLGEIEAIEPRDDDERSALDIARVDAASAIDEPARVLPALVASERAMPENYNASLRLAQMAEAAKQYDIALAACERGLTHVTGPLGRSWLLTTRANVLDDRGDRSGARAALAQALEVARGIGNPRMRESNVRRIGRALEEYDKRQE